MREIFQWLAAIAWIYIFVRGTYLYGTKLRGGWVAALRDPEKAKLRRRFALECLVIMIPFLTLAAFGLF